MYTESILFRRYGVEPSVFNIYFISFFVPVQYQLFSLPLFFFAHLILSMLGFICFFTFCMFVGVLLIVFANDFGFDVSFGYEFAFEFALSQ